MKIYLAALMLHASMPFVCGDLMDTGSFREMTQKLSQLRKEKDSEDARVNRARRVSVTPLDLPAEPSQKFFIPLHEDDLLNDAFHHVFSESDGPVESFFSLAVSVPGTIIWYDHFEDGYDNNGVTDPINHVGSPGGTTEVWGDRNATNGCEPNQDPCTDDTDEIKAGSSIVIGQLVDIDHVGEPYYYNAGDMIHASLPIAVTRGAFPSYPGSVLAGAVEVLDTSIWGTEYAMPLDNDSPTDTEAFEITGYFIMAELDNTHVTIPGDTGDIIKTLHQGEGTVIHENVEVGNTITADNPIQVHIITGDRDSYYEMRWFSLIPVDRWKDRYLSPVGDSKGNVKVIVYNPNPNTIKVHYEYKGGSTKKTLTVNSERNGRTKQIPDNSAVELYSKDGEPFAAYVLVDNKVKKGQGQVHDWGFPVTPKEDLTPSVLIGWGYGCSNLLWCSFSFRGLEGTRSPVWVTPVEDATIYCDYTGDGVPDDEQVVQYLKRGIFEADDHDLSGALLWAVNETGHPVKFAAAWGQNPKESNNQDFAALDLGTVVPPLATVHASKTCEVAIQNPDCPEQEGATVGALIKYTIFITASGGFNIEEELMTITDELDVNVQYVQHTTKYINGTVGSENIIEIADDVNGATKFPLDEDGIKNPAVLHRGTTASRIEFVVEVMTMPIPAMLTNKGNVTLNGAFNEVVEFENKCPMALCSKEYTPPPTTGPKADCPEDEEE